MNFDRIFNLLGLIVIGVIVVRVMTHPQTARIVRTGGQVFVGSLRQIGAASSGRNR